MTDVRREIKELDLEIGFETSRLERLKQKYHRDCGNILKRLFTMDEKYVLKRQDYQDRIDNQKDLVASLEKHRYESTILQFDYGMNFFARVISLVENEDYRYKRLSLRDISILPPNFSYTNDCSYQVIDNKVGLVARREVVEGLTETRYHNSRDLETELIEENEKNIVADAFYELEIFNDKEVPENLIYDFPYLEQVCNEIVSLKINNPGASEVEICEAYLRNLKIKLNIRRGAYHK